MLDYTKKLPIQAFIGCVSFSNGLLILKIVKLNGKYKK